MNKPIQCKIELQETFYVPFSMMELPAGTVINGYYDGYSITFFKDNVCHQLYIADTKHRVII